MAAGLTGAGIIIGIAHGAVPAFSRLRSDLDRALDAFGELGVRELLCVSVMAGLGEEALFRGLLPLALEPGLGVTGALLIASAAFGFLHCVSLSYVLYTALVGAALALLTRAQGLLAAVVAHAVMDAAAFCYGVLVFRPMRDRA